MVTTAADSVFIDTNILIYAQLTLVPQHHHALDKLAGLTAEGRSLCISRQVLREYVAALSRPGLLTQPLTMDELASDVQQFAQSFRILEDGPDVTEYWLGLLRQSVCAGRQVHDANIAATMLASDIHILLTNNASDFRRFQARIEIMPLIV